MGNRAKIIVYWFAGFVFFLAVGFGCQSGSKDDPPSNPNEPPIDISADELYAAYDKDVKNANDRFRGKTVRVKGNVTGLDLGVILGKDAGIACMIKPGSEDQIGKIWLNDIVTVKGVCNGPKDAKAKVLFVYVTQAEIIDIQKAKR
jgi:hypothetical protein